MNAAKSGDWLDSPTGELTPDELTFLGKEYDHLVSSLLANEESGEKRVSLFLTFVGVGSIALSIVAESAGDGTADVAWAIGLIATLVLLVGLMTLQRTIGRNIHTDELITSLGRIRRLFIGVNPNLARVLPFVPETTPKRRPRGVDGERWWGIGRGGLLEMVALANSYLLGVIGGACMVAAGARTADWVGTAAILAVAGWFLQMRYARDRYRDEQEASEERRNAKIENLLAGLSAPNS